MVKTLNLTNKCNIISNLSISCLFLLFFLSSNANAEFWVKHNSITDNNSGFIKNTRINENGLFTDFGVYRDPLNSKDTDYGFFVHNDIGTALGSMGVDLLHRNIKSIKNSGLAGYGYSYNNETKLLLGFNLPNSHIQESAYISFTIGGAW